MNDKKSQINQVFVYILSVIVIVFVGYLVVTFVAAFLGDSQTQSEVKIYKDLKKNLEKVQATYSAQEILKTRVVPEVEKICFANSLTCIDNLDMSDAQKIDFISAYEGGDNVAQFEGDNILNSDSLIENSACFCATPINNNIEFVLENNRNELLIYELE